MASTLQIITEVSNRTMSKLTIRPSEWTSFLSTAARNYKYSFAEQVLIYAQRPYATACAPIELWNERFGRRVKRGSHGIALIDDSSAKLRLRYVFDVSDTVKSVGRPVPIWQMDEKYVEPVIEALEAGFGDLAHKNDIAEAILSASDNAVEDNMTDYLTELFTVREDSFLEELDDFNVEVALKRAIRASVAYMVLTRCGVDASKYFEVDDFIPILDFNTILAISLLGSAVSDISEMVLGEIGDTIRYQRVVENHKLAKSKNIVQNVNVSRKNNVERGDEHGDDIHNAGRLPFARPDTAGAAVHREIWDAAQIIPQKPSAGDVHQPASLREADGSPRGDRQDGTGARRADDGADGLDGERERGDESLRPDEMDGADEQPEALGGGNDSDGTDLQLTDEQSDEPEGDKPSGLLSGSVVLPSVAEQISIIEQAEAQTSVFSVSQQIIDAVLSSGGNAKNSTLRIFAKYTRDKSAEDNITFLRREYKRGGKGFIIDGKKVSALWSPEEGMRIAFGETTFLAGEMVPLGWDQIERRIRELIELSRYIPQSDVLAVPEYERQELASRIWDTCRDDLSGIPKEWRSEKGGFPEDVKKIATLLSDPVVLADIISHLETEIAAYDAQKRRGYHDVHQLLNDVRDMRRDPRTFTAQEAIAEECEYFITQDEIDAELCRGGQTQDGKYRIYHFFKGNSDSKDRVDFLKHEYGTGGRADGVYNIWNDAKGLSIRKHIVTDPDGKMLLTWPKVARRIGELIAADRYLTGKEKERLPTVEAELVERARLSAERKAARAILERAPEPNRENAEYALSLGAEVHIGADPYEILSIDPDRVVLFDPAFPLFNKEMTREEFDRKVRENPLNDHLIVKEPAIAPQRSSDDVFDEYSALFVSKVLFDEAYMNARSNADEQNAKTECDDAMQRVFHAFDPLEHTALYKAFTESPSFAQRMKDHVFQKTYIEFADMIEPGEVSDSSPVGRLHDVTSTPDGDAEYADQDMALQDEPEPQDLKPTWEKHTDNIIRVRIDLMPETPAVDRINFRITDDNLGHGGPKAKYGLNVAAIRALQLIEADNRLATAEEQEVLSRYVGWGGVADVFDENKPEWAKEYAELKELLSDDEYRSARESVLNAHYTSPVVIKAIYSALENMGFRTGNILEPGCGVGNFFGLVPESMENSRLYGVELDSITGRIARQLYQRASIRVQGYEAANLPDSFFDVAIGNVPFGQYSVPDKRYDKLKLSIHDYFFAKTLDKVRPGGVVAFITSSFTMDKKTSAVRKYIAERAELLGAVRLPNNAFLRNAGTSVVTDILFLQKRDRPIETEPSWVHLGKTADGFAINQYFIDNPHMVLGRLAEEHTQYGHMALTCMPIPGAELSEQLRDAMANINAEIAEYGVEDLAEKEEGSIPADPSVRNFSFAVVDGKLYYRENSKMNPIETSITGENRIKGMVEIRECVRQLIEYQTEDYSDDDIRQEQARLNRLYDSFTSRYGLLNIRANSAVFSDDSAYPLLCSLEVLDDEGNLKRKADMFSKRTIRRRAGVTHVDTAAEALAVSIGERARVDLGFMSSLMGKPGDIEGIADGLHGVIYKDPDAGDDLLAGWQTADEYLSGNVRKKLAIAKKAIELNPIYAANVEALEAVQPVDLTAAEISVRLGATWLPPDVVEQFVHELLSPPFYLRRSIKVHYMPYNSEWNIEGKNQDHGNVKAKATYGTERANAYKIIEETLNLRDIRVFDAVYDDSGNRTYVLNKKETAIARQKQSLIKQEFNDWIWKDPDRRERLCRLYNDKFNSVRPREYDGRHIQFIGMNPEMALRTHQINAVARVLYGGNTLLAHVVGAGKTFEMVAAAMESKRLGLCQKSMIVVPNHLTEQWAAEFLQLYPAANILVATRKDFETQNRKKFCGRIATGDFDAVIIGHSQFEKIPLSIERQKAILNEQIDTILASIADAKANRSEKFTIKQLEKSRKGLELKLKKLNDQSRKDDVVTFEELGVDRLFIDESHFFKNLFLFTKMRNVAGIAQTEAQKSSDLFAKCRYLDELTGGRGTIFATGTPISNSMVELYTVQRYLQYDVLQRELLENFDAWASNYGETVTAIELSPEGTGYRSKTRFAKFYNLPELMAMFKEIADIQTADMLNLPVPKAIYHNIPLKPSELQREMVAGLSERADRVRNKEVEPTEDNMLLITNDGRKLALDQRLINPMLPDHENSKASACAENVFTLWREHADTRATQLVFCDLSTPKGDGSFNVYDDIRNKLIAKGIPAEEIAYIHDANTETKKKELFGKVRSGQVRVLLGSTFKMGVRP